MRLLGGQGVGVTFRRLIEGQMQKWVIAATNACDKIEFDAFHSFLVEFQANAASMGIAIWDYMCKILEASLVAH